MKKIIKTSLVITLIIVAAIIIYFIYIPFAKGFIDEKWVVGDSLMHLANILAIKANHPFPIIAWKVEWGGYPLIEGYPWLHYYLIQPILSFFSNPGVAMDYYSACFLYLYYVISFILLFYTSKNFFLAILFTLVIIFGADSQMPFSVNSFMTFTASQLFLPLVLLVTIIAHQKENFKIFIISAILLSISFFSHGAMTGIVIIPVIFPFLILNNEGKITKITIINTIKYFFVFSLLSAIQIYQFISYSGQGYLRGVKPFPLDIIPQRFVNLLSWMNPILLFFIVLFIPLLIISLKKHFNKIKPYLFSLMFILLIFTLMLFNITSMNLVLLAERVLWAITLIYLIVFSRIIFLLTNSNTLKILSWIISLIFIVVYLYLVLLVKPIHLVPDTLKAMDPYNYKPVDIIPNMPKYSNKFDEIYSFSPLSWNDKFDNYRTDGISWSIYSNWNIWTTTNIRYKGRFPAAKDLPLEWSGLVGGAEYGMLGAAGTPDTSSWAINRSLFFFDWYGIRHIEMGETDFETASYLKDKPLITSSEKSLNIIYNDIDKNFIGPIYAPTNAKTIAVVSPETQYDNFIRTLSYTNFNSEKLIPIYLGEKLGSINKKNLNDFDAVYLYGYKNSLFSSNVWTKLADYVKNGGNLIIETGQKVSQTEINNLPEVFPVNKTKLTVVTKPWKVELEKNEITQNVPDSDFNPLNAKYLPYSISESSPKDLRSWAKPVLTKDNSIVFAYGKLGKGSVVWSGINLPFHAIDNRNTSEAVIFANSLNWFFPQFDVPIRDFEVEHPKSEKIIVSSDMGNGFLLKENYNPGWVAKLNNKRVKIYKAGLMQMYVVRNGTSKNKDVLVLKYNGSPIHWILFVISSISFLSILLYLIFNKNVLSLKQRLPRLSLIKNSDENDY